LAWSNYVLAWSLTVYPKVDAYLMHVE